MKLFKKTAVEVVGYNPYTEFVLGGWDYTINNKQSAEKKSKAIVKVQPIRAGYLGHVTAYQPIRDQYFLIRSVPGSLNMPPELQIHQRTCLCHRCTCRYSQRSCKTVLVGQYGSPEIPRLYPV